MVVGGTLGAGSSFLLCPLRPVQCAQEHPTPAAGPCDDPYKVASCCSSPVEQLGLPGYMQLTPHLADLTPGEQGTGRLGSLQAHEHGHIHLQGRTSEGRAPGLTLLPQSPSPLFTLLCLLPIKSSPVGWVPERREPLLRCL